MMKLQQIKCDKTSVKLLMPHIKKFFPNQRKPQSKYIMLDFILVLAFFRFDEATFLF